MIDPDRMRGVELGRGGAVPVRQTVAVVGGGADEEADEEVHDVEDGDFFGRGGEVGEGADDVGEEAGDGVGVGGAVGVKEAVEGGVGGAEEVEGGGGAVGGALAAFGVEVEEETVEGAGWGGVLGEG